MFGPMSRMSRRLSGPPYEHPYPVQQGHMPTFPTQHQARNFIADYQARGMIRKCTHVRVGPAAPGTISGHRVYCAADSFDLVPLQQPSEHGIGIAFAALNGCPAGCRLYEPEWLGKLKRRLSHPLTWFEGQPWQVKVAVIAVPGIVVILVAAAYFGVLKDLITLVRAIGDAWRNK